MRSHAIFPSLTVRNICLKHTGGGTFLSAYSVLTENDREALVFSVSVCMEWGREGSNGKLQTEIAIRCDVRMIGHDVSTYRESGHQDVPGQGKLLRESDVEVEAFKTNGTSPKMREIKWLKN